jgi:hypothetical protein
MFLFWLILLNFAESGCTGSNETSPFFFVEFKTVKGTPARDFIVRFSQLFDIIQ